jgi:hypothetical protein
VTTARSVTPVDLPALLASTGGYRNQAWPRERLGDYASPSPLSVVMDKFVSLGRSRSAWVTTDRQRLRGLVAARPRAERSAWEIDYLVEGSDDPDALASLIDRAIAETGEDGAEKLFVRIESGSDLLQLFREAAFNAYREEVLYRYTGRLPRGEASLEPLAPSDSYPLFRLYNASTPEAERRCEAATFAEWHATQDRRWLRKGVELVQASGGKYEAYVRAGKLPWGTLVDLVADPEASRCADALVARAAVVAGADDTAVYVLVAKSAQNVATRLEEAGFDAVREYVCCVHRTTVLKTLPRSVPAVARNVASI